MAEPKETMWQIQEHTKAKHVILRRYLGAWFAIMGSSNSSVMYIDGFCGPGRYTGGECGSPVIALEEAIAQYKYLQNADVTFIFSDIEIDRIQHLKTEIDLLQPPPKFDIRLETDSFENVLINIFNNLGKNNLPPTFAFIDPFGFAGLPFSLVQRLLKYEKTEVFITFMLNSINRFIDHPDPSIQKHFQNLFGVSADVLQQAQSGSNQQVTLRELYQMQLRGSAKFVRYFEMLDDHNKCIYDLFFAGNHSLGHQRMKEAFWKVDSQKGYKFSDRTNPDQPILFELDPSFDLAKQLVNRFRGTKRISDYIIQFVRDNTGYIDTHTKKALVHLEKSGDIKVDPIKQDGNKRTKGFPPGVVIQF
jgi:three-Cys-motif partner protein